MVLSYNKKTKKIVTGINGGTSNKATWAGALDHWWKGDIDRFDRCGTPTEQQKMLGEYLARNPQVLEWLAENPERINSLLENIKLDISEARRKAKGLLLGDKRNAHSQLSNNETVSDSGLQGDASIAKQLQPDLHNLNLDDSNGDWCKCNQPGCSANMDAKNGNVVFGCTKCKKVNVKYAKMALELEKIMKAAGTTPTWHGPNAEANAHKADSEK